MARTSSTKVGSGPSSFVRLRVTISRPRCQVVSTTKTTRAIESGNQPPCRTLVRLAAKKVRSTVRNSAEPASTSHSGLRHR